MAEKKDVQRETAGFNKAISFLEHIDSLEKTCTKAALNKDYPLWIDTLQLWFNKMTGKLDEHKILVFLKDLNFIKEICYIEEINFQIKEQELHKMQIRLEKLATDFGFQMHYKDNQGPQEAIFR